MGLGVGVSWGVGWGGLGGCGSGKIGLGKVLGSSRDGLVVSCPFSPGLLFGAWGVASPESREAPGNLAKTWAGGGVLAFSRGCRFFG